MKDTRVKDFIFINFLFVWYSFVGMFSKNAAQYSFLSTDYLKWYAGVVFVMGLYAVLWQQALKKLPLTTAYANKAIVTVWSVLWGYLFWNENITVGKIIGTVFIIVGIVLVVTGDKTDVEI